MEVVLVVRASRSLTGYPAERGSGGALLGETPNGLGATAILPKIPTLRQQKNIGPRPTLRRIQISGYSNSTNAVSFSSACTTKRFPSPRCASAIQIVRRLESIAETQPRLQPEALSLSAMISQYFTRGRILPFLLSTRQ